MPVLIASLVLWAHTFRLVCIEGRGSLPQVRLLRAHWSGGMTLCDWSLCLFEGIETMEFGRDKLAKQQHRADAGK